jgi:hypothetical protein
VQTQRKVIPVLLGLLILTSSGVVQFSPFVLPTAEAETAPRIVGYFPYYRGSDIGNMDYSKVTDINYFGIYPKFDGSLITNNINIGQLETIRDDAHASGVNVLVTIGGGGMSSDFPAMTANETARTNFVNNVKNFLIDNNLDGVDINWEPIDTDAKKNNMALLLGDLASALQPQGKLVTAAVNSERIELLPSTIDSLNWANIMTYDMNWNSAEHSLYSDAIVALSDYEEVGFPPEKLMMGIPFYGRTDGWSSALMYETMVDSCSLEGQPEVNTCDGHWFNGVDLVQQKAQYVLDNDYGGIMIWELGQDTYDGTSLLNAINQVLGSASSNESPVAVNDSASINEGDSTNIDLASNDTDSDGVIDPSTINIVTEPLNGMALINNDGSIDYSHDGSETDFDSLTYTIKDDTGATSNQATVSITVFPTNDAPIADDQSIITNEDTPVGITLTGSDVDDTTLSFSVVDGPSNGILTGVEPNLTYTPDNNFNGNDSFTFQANDGEFDSNIATVFLSVNQQSELHLEDIVGDADDKKRWKGTATIFVNDEEENPYSGATVAGTWQNGQSSSCVTDAGQCQVSQTTRDESLIFAITNIADTNTIYNSDANHVSETVTIFKGGSSNQSPTADVGGPYSGNEGDSIAFDGSASEDPNGSITSYSWDFGDGSSGTGVVPHHTYSYAGTYNISLTVTDNDGETDTASTTVQISSIEGEEEDLTISNITPNTMIKGTTESVMIEGVGFDSSTSITFGGEKWTPKILSTVIMDSHTINIEVSRSGAGPDRVFFYDVIATNSNGRSVILEDVFTVTSP